MSDQPKTDFSTVFKFATPPTQQQAELFEGMNALMSAWMKRRHEALETGLQALQKMSATQDPATAARICADWMGGSFNRLLADMSDAREHSLRLMELGQKSYQTLLSNQAAAVADATAKTAAATETPLRQAA
jgi:hypothetical protein